MGDVTRLSAPEAVPWHTGSRDYLEDVLGVRRRGVRGSGRALADV